MRRSSSSKTKWMRQGRDSTAPGAWSVRVMVHHVLMVCLIVATTGTGELCGQDNRDEANNGAPIQPTQQVSADDSNAAAEQITSESIGGMIVSGGTLNLIFFSVLGVFSLWAATVVLERIVNLRRNKLLPEAFEKEFAELIQEPLSSPDRFQRQCDGSNVAASRILQAGVIRAGRPVPEVEKAMEDAAAREMALLRAKSRPLGVVGSVAPLVGLLGTVVGMIMAFQISSQEGLGKAERLAEGIYLALMTTAAGLTIAIPCLLFASWFQARAERYMCDISDCLTKSLPSFARMEGRETMPAQDRSGQVSLDELSARERFLREGMTKSASD